MVVEWWCRTGGNRRCSIVPIHHQDDGLLLHEDTAAPSQATPANGVGHTVMSCRRREPRSASPQPTRRSQLLQFDGDGLQNLIHGCKSDAKCKAADRLYCFCRSGRSLFSLHAGPEREISLEEFIEFIEGRKCQLT